MLSSFKSLIIIAIVSVLVVFNGSSIRAQVVTEATSASQLIFTTPERALERESLLNNYRTELISYQQAERDFNFKKSQYNQLQTIASLETAVVAGRELHTSRDRVLNLYFKIIKIDLIDTLGIDLTAKQRLETEINELLLQLDKHLTTATNIFTREQLETSSESYESLNETALEIRNRTEKFIKIGRLQTGYDRVDIAIKELQTVVNQTELSQLQQEQKKRAFDLVLKEQTDLKDLLTDFNTRIITPEDKQRSLPKDTAEASLINMESAYADLLQLVTYLKEIASNI